MKLSSLLGSDTLAPRSPLQATWAKLVIRSVDAHYAAGHGLNHDLKSSLGACYFFSRP